MLVQGFFYFNKIMLGWYKLRRYEELDSMRGLAATSVIIWHTMLIILVTVPGSLLILPTNILYAGNEAVLFFFVLSGFVMSLPFYKKDIGYTGFLIKRFFRIYVPYLLLILFTFLLYAIFKDIQADGLSGWYYRKWATPLDIKTFVEYILFLGIYPTEYNPVIWSLIHELRISIIFPLLMMMTKKYNWKTSLLIGFLFYAIASLNELFNIQSSYGAHTSVFDSLHYMFFFIIGALLAKHKDELTILVQSYSVSKKLLLTIVALVFYSYSRFYTTIVAKLFGEQSFLMDLNFTVVDLGRSVGVSLLIILVLSSIKAQKILTHPTLILTGNISYSLYMIHMPILLVVFRLLYERTSLFIVVIVAYVLIYGFSYLSYKYIEQPFNNLGRKIAGKDNKTLKSNTAQEETVR